MFVNLTPHDIVVFDGDGREEILRVPSSGVVRAAEIVTPQEGIEGVAVVATSFGPLEGADLSPKEGVTFIVSPFVGGHEALKGRADVVCPDTGPASVVRDAEGKILGVKRLRRLL